MLKSKIAASSLNKTEAKNDAVRNQISKTRSRRITRTVRKRCMTHNYRHYVSLKVPTFGLGRDFPARREGAFPAKMSKSGDYARRQLAQSSVQGQNALSRLI